VRQAARTGFERSWLGLPIETSPAKVANDEQHKNDDDDDPNPGHAILSLGARRLYGESTRVCNASAARGPVTSGVGVVDQVGAGRRVRFVRQARPRR
jgi:hypothetical protein